MPDYSTSIGGHNTDIHVHEYNIQNRLHVCEQTGSGGLFVNFSIHALLELS